MKIKLLGCYPVILNFSSAHWQRNGTNHGSKSRPSVIAASLVRLGVQPPTAGLRLWIYVRGGYAWFAEIYVDRREAR